MELKANGRNIPLTNENRLEYIQRLADLKLNTQLKKQCAAFREGLNSVVPLLWLKLFNHKELQVIVGGDTHEIDLDDLRAHTTYSGNLHLIKPERYVKLALFVQATLQLSTPRCCHFGESYMDLRIFRKGSYLNL